LKLSSENSKHDLKATKYISTILCSSLFQGIDQEDVQHLLTCLDMYLEQYHKKDIILFTGDPIKRFGLILTGQVRVLREDTQGNQNIITELGSLDLYAEVFCCAGVPFSPVTVEAKEETVLLSIDYASIIKPCTKSCGYHNRFITNMLGIIAEKTLVLNRRVEILSRRTTREKILCYLEGFQETEQDFKIPFNREELASYLCVDRSALSAELSRMRRDGLLTFYKNKFRLIHQNNL